MSRSYRKTILAGAVLAVWICAIAGRPATGLGNPPDDPAGVLRKPIPDKLVILTFDDGPASHATIVAPILKKYGFGGSFYVCDFDSFKTRKDWYLTWRQMKALAEDGFEVGNHTVGHGGGLNNYLAMEDQLLAHDVPKPTTLAWPVYAVIWDSCPGLAANGYIFGRGGHNRPYRPTVDHPFDIPCLGAGTVEEFVRNVRQATGGKIVVITYHGVPDMEHPAVSLAPEIFEVQMQYLKDNHYTVKALRDLAEYIDPVKAAKLPPTSDKYQATEPVVLASEEKPPVALNVPQPEPGTDLPGKSSADEARVATAVNANQPNVFTWDRETGGRWSDGSRWSQDLAKDTAPLRLDADLTVNVARHGEINLQGAISGPGRLVKEGQGRLQIADRNNTYGGGTVVNNGTLFLLVANRALGTGPLTLNPGAVLVLEHVDGTNPLILNGGEIYAGNGFGDTWNAPIILNGNIDLTAYANFNMNDKSGGISGTGGITMCGGRGGFGPVNSGWVTLWGTNTYTGPTTVRLGTLIVKRAGSLYNADVSHWTPEKITVCNTATLSLSVGGPGEFTGEQIDTLLKNLTASIRSNGLMGGSVLVLDTTNASETVTLAVNIEDSKGPGGGPFILKKSGGGALRLTGTNTWSGQTMVDGGTVIVSSINRVAGGKPSSSLGAPTTLENGIIGMGGDCTLVYTGKGEVTDRIIDLTGKRQTVTLDQSGTGLLKFTSPFDISGYGFCKTVVLAGSTAAGGELAANIRDPYDRMGLATTSLTKTGTGTWTLSGSNSYTGPTTVNQGTLRLAGRHSLGVETELSVAPGAMLDLDFPGEIHVRKLILGGAVQPAGRHDAASDPEYIRGTGVVGSRL